MSYETGSAADLPALLTKIRDFALADGWTIDKFVSSGTIANNLLFMTKGICAVAFQGATATRADFTSGSNVPYTDHMLRATLATSINAALNTYFGHPGALATTATHAVRVQVNDLNGAFGEYHLFSNAAETHIHLAVRSGTDRWQHLSFGVLDKGEFTHGGVAFLAGSSKEIVRRTADGVTNTQTRFNDPKWTCRAGVLSCVNGDIGTGSYFTEGRPLQLYAPDALPNEAGFTSMFASQDGNETNMFGIIPTINGLTSPADAANSSTAINTLGFNLVYAEPSQWGGYTTLMALPVVVASTSGANRTCYIGDFPDVRGVNLTGLVAAQTIDMGGEEWIVFPTARQYPWAQRADAAFVFTSGQYGIAYKKVA